MKKIIDLFISFWNKGFFHVLVANVFVAFAAFGSQLFVAKILSDVQLGYIKIFQSFTQILSLVAGMGFSTSALIVCSGSPDMKEKMKFFSVALFAVVPISILTLAVFIIFNQSNTFTQIEEVKLIFNKYSFLVIFTAIIAVYTSFIQSSRIFKKYSVLVIITKFLSIALIIFFTYLRGFYGFFEGTCLGMFFSLLINITFVKREFNFFIQVRIPGLLDLIKQQFRLGIHGLGTNLFGMIAGNIDIILLSFMYSDQATIGQYSFAAIFIVGLNMIQGTIVQITVPYLAKYKNDISATKSLLKKYNVVLLVGATVLLLSLYIALPLLIDFVYGNKYNQGVIFLLFLLGVWFFRCLNAINASYFLSSGRSNLSNLVSFVSMGLNTLSVFVSLKFFTIEFMAISMIFANLGVTLFSHYLVKKSLLQDIIN